MSRVLQTALFLVPLALDTFAVSAAVGVAGVPREQRLRLSMVFAGFETVMPLVGFAVGRALGSVAGSVADYVAVALLLIVGALVLRGEEDEAASARALATTRGFAVVSLGLSVSLDELAIGLSIGLLGLPVLLVVALIGVQAFVAAQLGHRIGARVGEELTEGAEKLAGLALIGLGLLLLGERVL